MALINKEQEYQDQEDWSNDVEKLKGYKELKDKVEYWAKQTDHSFLYLPVIDGSYEIVYDNELGWCVDVDGDVSFAKLDIKEIPFQFRNVSGIFNCYKCDRLTSLKGCPIYVSGYFSCQNSKNLTSLEGCPKKVEGNFYCYGCVKKFTEEYVRSLCNVKRDIYN